MSRLDVSRPLPCSWPQTGTPACLTAAGCLDWEQLEHLNCDARAAAKVASPDHSCLQTPRGRTPSAHPGKRPSVGETNRGPGVSWWLVSTMGTLPAGTSPVLGEEASHPHQGLGGCDAVGKRLFFPLAWHELTLLSHQPSPSLNTTLGCVLRSLPPQLPGHMPASVPSSRL